MELSAKYVYKVYTEKSFSAAAKALFLSQPALSAAVSRHEKELGIRIFDRTTVPLSLTPEGRIYIEMLEEIMESENNMRHRLRRLSAAMYGSLSVGISSYTSYYLLPTICGAFYRRHPEVEISIDAGNIGAAGNLQQKLKRQVLDLLLSYEFDPHEQEATPIFEEQLVIAMHRMLPGAAALAHLAVSREELLGRSYPPEKELSDLSVFAHVPFLSFAKRTNTYRYMADLLGDYTVAPCSIQNARHSVIHYNMMCAGVGAVMTSTSAVAVSSFPCADILYFVPKGKRVRRTMYAVYKKGIPQEPIVKEFIDVAREVAASDKALSLYI